MLGEPGVRYAPHDEHRGGEKLKTDVAHESGENTAPYGIWSFWRSGTVLGILFVVKRRGEFIL